jgi:hypothetical protein
VQKWYISLDACQMFFSTDGEPWKMAWPGRGETADVLVRAAAGDDVNLVQQVYYNGCYGFASAKAQHVLQANGKFILSPAHCVAMMQWLSNPHHESVLYINNNPF